MFKKTERSNPFNFEKVVINLTLFCALWLSFIYFSGQPASTNLDASWSQALGYFFKHNFQVGVDYIFGYGTLGYFFQPFTAYDADLYYLLVAWWVIIGLVSAALFLVIARNIQLVTEKFLYFTSLLFIISFVTDARYFLVIIVITILIIEPPHFIRSPIRHFTATALAALILVILSMTKFTIFTLSSFCVLSIAIIFLHHYSYKVAITFLGSYVAIFIGVWIFLGQSVLNIPSFLVNSLEISRGHINGMAHTGEPLEIYLALATIGIIMILIGISNFKSWNLVQFLINILVLFGLYLAWKAGFVRQDTGHVLIFFGFSILAPFLIKRSHFGNLRSVIFRILLFLNFIICFMGIQFSGYDSSSNLLGAWNQRVVDNFNILSSLHERKKNLDNIVEQFRKEHDLPKTRAIVRQATIDIFSWEQGVIFLNKFNWHPRPIFQSYLAYTPTLISANGRFYASEQAPEFVLFKLQTIDGQFPWLNDSEALRILLRDYKPLFVEKNFLLLQHQTVNYDFAEPKSLLTRTVNFGESIVLDNFKDKNLILSIEIEKSLLGKIISLLYKSSFVYMEIETLNGTKFSYRLIPEMAQSGFLINPLIQNQSELMKWYAGESLPQVATVRIVTSETGLHYFFKPTIAVQINSLAQWRYRGQIWFGNTEGVKLCQKDDCLCATQYSGYMAKQYVNGQWQTKMLSPVECGNAKADLSVAITLTSPNTVTWRLGPYPQDQGQYYASVLVANADKQTKSNATFSQLPPQGTHTFTQPLSTSLKVTVKYVAPEGWETYSAPLLLDPTQANDQGVLEVVWQRPFKPETTQ